MKQNLHAHAKDRVITFIHDLDDAMGGENETRATSALLAQVEEDFAHAAPYTAQGGTKSANSAAKPKLKTPQQAFTLSIKVRMYMSLLVVMTSSPGAKVIISCGTAHECSWIMSRSPILASPFNLCGGISFTPSKKFSALGESQVCMVPFEMKVVNSR